MATFYRARGTRRRFLNAWNLALGCLLVTIAFGQIHAQENQEIESYKIRFDGFWFYSQPSGSFHGTGNQGRLDLQADLNFNSYNTLATGLDWKFTHKNHLTLTFVPFDSTQHVTLNRTVLFQGQTFGVGLQATGRLQTDLIAPGYRYDFIRRRRGHLGIMAQLDLLYIRGSLNAAAQTLNGTTFAAQRSSSTLRAPLPVAGPDFRYYFTNSGRVFVDANLLGMYFFGYGNFISSYGTIGVALNKNLNFQGGYSLGSRLNIKSKSNRIGLNLSQRGAVAGIEASF